MKTNSWLVLAVLVLVLAGIAFFATPAKPCKEGCNVILIMVDTLSAQHLATYGYDRDTMPKTTAFFEDNGVIFTDASSNAPWTLPSFTSMYFSDLATHITYAELEDGSRPTLQSELRDAGVTVRAVVPQPKSFITDTITRLFTSEELIPVENKEQTFPTATTQLTELVKKQAPFFLLVHTFEVHDPYDPIEPYDSLFDTTDESPVVTREDLWNEYSNHDADPKRVAVYQLRYDQQISEIDARIATFLETIPEAVLEDTVVILAADHGEAFNQHGFLLHGNSLFIEELHVPLLLRVPGVSAKRIDEPVSLLDMTPTILDITSGDIPSSFLGKSLVPLFSGNKLGARAIPVVNGRPYYFGNTLRAEHVYDSLQAAGAVGANRTLIEPFAIGVRSGSQFLFTQAIPERQAGRHWYNLEQDPKETYDLLIEGEAPAKLQEILERYILSGI